MNFKILRIAKPAFTVLLASLLFAACKKDDTTPTDPEPDYRQEILLSPFPNIGIAPATQEGQLQIISMIGDTFLKKEFNYGVHDFKRWIVNREVRYTYLKFNPLSLTLFNGYLGGHYIVADKDMNELQEIKLLPHGERTESDPSYLDGHDFILIDDNHYISMAYYVQKVNNIPTSLSPNPNCKVVLNIIQEVKNGQVIWEWNSGDYPELYEASVQGNNYQNDSNPQDYLHLNSISIDPNDNNIIGSFRNADMVMKINRQNGKIMWKLGGNGGDYPMPSNQRFYRQHQATITDDGKTLLLFDNGEASERPYSRIVEFQLDEVAKKVTGFKAQTLPEFCQYMGSVQKTDSSYFVGGGSKPVAWEIDIATGKVIWYKTLSSNSYRVMRY